MYHFGTWLRPTFEEARAAAEEMAKAHKHAAKALKLWSCLVTSRAHEATYHALSELELTVRAWENSRAEEGA